MRTTSYQVGDRVVPVDLPRPLVCRVEATDEVALGDGACGQILTLRPLDGPWEQGTTLLRLDVAVRPVAHGGAARETRHDQAMTRAC
jgi:hypothetical protein